MQTELRLEFVRPTPTKRWVLEFGPFTKMYANWADNGF